MNGDNVKQEWDNIRLKHKKKKIHWNRNVYRILIIINRNIKKYNKNKQLTFKIFTDKT